VARVCSRVCGLSRSRSIAPVTIELARTPIKGDAAVRASTNHGLVTVARRVAFLCLLTSCSACGSRGPLATDVPGHADASTPDVSTHAIACTGTPSNARGTAFGATVVTQSDDCSGAEKTSEWGHGAPGSACASWFDCTPACCVCSATTGLNALTAWCYKGRCADSQEACCFLVGTPPLSLGSGDAGSSCL
jgi:hypothetical protein